MKKLLVLLLVFGMASVAGATLQISVGGNPEPADSQIYLEPSETLIIDIWTDTDITPGVGEGYWGIGVLPADGTLSGGVGLGQGTDTTIYADAGYVSPEAGPWGGIATATVGAGGYAAGFVLYDDIVFHCVREGETVINLYWDIFVEPMLVDSVTIHQVPEPMTVALLGLGGLFLLRRRK